jgi:hypothetical protein
MLADECQPGTTYMITASGLLTDTSAVAGHVYLLLDGTSTTLATTPAKSFATSITNLAWEFNAQITCDTTGSSGTIEVQGVAHYPNTTTSWLTNGTSNTAALTFNTTTSHTLYMGWGWSTLSTGASVTLRQFIVQRLGPQ